VSDIKGVEYIVFSKTSRINGFLDLKRQLAHRQFTVLLQMQAALRASLVAWAIPAELRVGFHPRMAKDFQHLFTRHHTRAQTNPHVIDGFFGFLEVLGITERRLNWHLPIPQSAQDKADDILGQVGKKYLIISPCASVRYRNWRDWPSKKYAHIIDWAWRRFGLKSILTGGPTEYEKKTGVQIVKNTACIPLNLIGQTNIKTLLALIARASAVISPDSGPIHLANALGVPPIGLFATSNPDRTGPYCLRKWVVNSYPLAVKATFGKTVEEVPWGKRIRNANAIDNITVDRVEKMISDVMDQKTC
jgi:heptosyltransferase I